jgi:hypothetical protein
MSCRYTNIVDFFLPAALDKDFLVDHFLNLNPSYLIFFASAGPCIRSGKVSISAAGTTGGTSSGVGQSWAACIAFTHGH